MGRPAGPLLHVFLHPFRKHRSAPLRSPPFGRPAPPPTCHRQRSPLRHHPLASEGCKGCPGSADPAATGLGQRCALRCATSVTACQLQPMNILPPLRPAPPAEAPPARALPYMKGAAGAPPAAPGCSPTSRQARSQSPGRSAIIDPWCTPKSGCRSSRQDRGTGAVCASPLGLATQRSDQGGYATRSRTTTNAVQWVDTRAGRNHPLTTHHSPVRPADWPQMSETLAAPAHAPPLLRPADPHAPQYRSGSRPDESACRSSARSSRRRQPTPRAAQRRSRGRRPGSSAQSSAASSALAPRQVHSDPLPPGRLASQPLGIAAGTGPAASSPGQGRRGWGGTSFAAGAGW